MILSCPACQSQFKVDPALLGPEGRRVRCAKCAYVWKVGPDGAAIQTGQFGMKSTRQAAAAFSAPEQPASDRPVTKKVPTPEPQTRPAAAPGAEAAEPAATTSGEQKIEADAGTAAPEAPATPEAAAGAAVRAARRAQARKGGRKFRIFLLLVCLAVIGLFMAGVITGRIGLGGLSPLSQGPSIRDVAPPPPAAPKKAQ